jgi:hypothetical protein
MEIPATLRRINRHGVSSVFLLLLLGASGFAHFLAHVRMEAANRQFAIMDDRTIRQTGVIDFMCAHYWIGIAYGAVFLACLLWLEFRSAPRWAVWGTFCVLALPCIVYAGACLRIGNKFILWTTT